MQYRQWDVQDTAWKEEFDHIERVTEGLQYQHAGEFGDLMRSNDFRQKLANSPILGCVST